MLKGNDYEKKLYPYIKTHHLKMYFIFCLSWNRKLTIIWKHNNTSSWSTNFTETLVHLIATISHIQIGLKITNAIATKKPDMLIHMYIYKYILITINLSKTYFCIYFLNFNILTLNLLVFAILLILHFQILR